MASSSAAPVPMKERMRTTVLLLCAAALAGCDSGYIPYVPGPGFTQTIEVSAELPDSSAVAVGEWITIHASRQSGPWVLADSTTEDPPCERISPVTVEAEAASKVEWLVDPPGRVTFNTPAPPEYERLIQFAQPGRYRLTATANGCGAPFESNTIEIVVE